jgi:hypothetical protein
MFFNSQIDHQDEKGKNLLLNLESEDNEDLDEQIILSHAPVKSLTMPENY